MLPVHSQPFRALTQRLFFVRATLCGCPGLAWFRDELFWPFVRQAHTACPEGSRRQGVHPFPFILDLLASNLEPLTFNVRRLSFALQRSKSLGQRCPNLRAGFNYPFPNGQTGKWQGLQFWQYPPCPRRWISFRVGGTSARILGKRISKSVALW